MLFMQNMTVSIDKESIVDGMHRNTALLAQKSENGAVIVYNDDDVQRLEPLWMASLDELLQLFHPFARMSVTDKSAEYLLSMPANWDNSQEETLTRLALGYLVTALTARWLDAVKPDSAMLFRSLNSNTANAINEILYRRKRP